MTEKRFTLTHINEQHLSANLYDDKTFIGSIGIGAELIVELLNNLSEENKNLKVKVDFYKYFQKDARELEKENEQLEKKNKQLLSTIVEILDFIEDKREVSIEEMGRWWKEKEKELMIND